MSDLPELTIERDRIKAKLNRMKEFINNFKEDDDLNELKLRKSDLISTYKDFDKVQSNIEPVNTSREQKKAVLAEWTSFESLYYNLLSKIAKLADIPSLTPVVASQNQPLSETSVKLPDLNLPTFSGNYSSWTSFHDTFQTLIHLRSDLNNCQKFHYLKSCLKGDAFRAVEALSISTANYQAAWDLLIKRYNNIRLIIQDHVNSILSISKISKSTNSALRQLITEVNTNIEALKILKQPTHHWDAILVPIITEKLDYSSNREWQSKLNSEIPTLISLINFLEQKCLTLESLEACTSFNKPFYSSKHVGSSKDNKNFRENKQYAHLSLNNKQISCNYCKNNSHLMYKCVEFLNLSINARIQAIEKLKLCKNCLRSNHSSSDCKSKFKCKQCNQTHNTLIHQETSTQKLEEQKSSIATLHVNKQLADISSQKEVLLSTALIYVKDNKNNFCECRALLDVGSQSNIISESLAKKLNLNLNNNNVVIQGINQKSITSTQTATITIKSRINTFSSEISCLILPEITGNIPTYSLNKSMFNIPCNIQLADPNFNTSSPIDLLIGAGLFWKLLDSGRINSYAGQPQFVQTRLGWIVGGEIPRNTSTSVCNISVDINNTLDKQIERFWDLEECSNNIDHSSQENLCETHFVNNYKRDFDGRFTVKLPFGSENPILGTSKEMAIKRLHSLENKFIKKPLLKLEYSKFINEYLLLGHMELVLNDNLNNASYYLPHHEVFKQSSGKLRVVFDASAKTSNKKSLNDVLLTGPTIQQDLFSILTRFRTFQIAFSGDIVKMYRQIKVDTKDTNYQKILWREKADESILTYRLLTVTYGTTCAPFLAIRSLQQAAIHAKDKFPIASEVILRDFYVDDLLSGASSISEAIKLKQDINYILNNAGFEMAKWASNSPELIPLEQQNNEMTIDLSNDQQSKALGVVWEHKNDLLTYAVNLKYKENHTTKRSILSIIAQLWDPLGLISPIIIKAKLILQKMWTLKLSWDEKIPHDLHHMWSQFITDLAYVNNIKINRKVISLIPLIKIEIHGFCDSSQSAYRAVIFIRSFDSYGNYSVNLLCSKSRVAPLKALSIPRLELCGSLLLVRLMEKTMPTLNLNICKRFYWTDSTIVLCWIATPSNTWQTFVANRVAEIQNLSKINEWHHIGTKFNPADIISRGTSPKQLNDNNLWWHGPNWLQLPETQWPQSSFKTHLENIPEKRKTSNKIVLTNCEKNTILTKFSAFVKLQRVIAFIQRFSYNCKNKTSKRAGYLTVLELNNAQKTIIKMIQDESFEHELKDLRQNQYVKNHSSLYLLNPILDQDGLIRVGGRIKNSPITYDKKHPIILPGKHYVTKLLIIQEHERQLHADIQATFTSLRQKFWIISGRNVIRIILHKCLKCFRAQPKSINQTMGDLPKQRLEPVRPFIKTGIDYIGPIIVKEGSGRGKSKKVKAYIALFICFATKAIHLELVGNLTSDSFLAALKRFISRRGHVSDLYSDNATNFTAANKELRALFKSTQFQNVIDSLTPINIVWHFIPPRSPTLGGLWEANVKSVKRHLKRIIGDTNLNFEEMYTVLARIEACLNSRPLCPLSNDPNDLLVLTPGHFLIGEPLTAPVDLNLTPLPMNRLSRWQLTEQIRQHFWKRWHKEYLLQLQQRTKWNKPPINIELGSMVLINEDNITPQQWLLGRIVQLHPGKDGITRVASVKTPLPASLSED